MAKFSVGQQVVCVDASDTGDILVYGNVYEVGCGENLWFGVVSIDQVGGTWNENRFTLFEDKKETMNNTKAAKIPHIHAEMIIAWANGEKIEYHNRGEWYSVDSTGASWDVKTSYRIKPEPTYPTTTSDNALLVAIYGKSCGEVDGVNNVANEAIKHFIVSGDMDKYLESLK